jgi:glycosyltransferase involved in cell wall biosynthesis
MKILFITDNFPPEGNAPAARTYEHCLEWLKLGAEVTVITCVPNFPQGKVYEGYKNKIWQTENVDGIKVVRVWSYMYANQGFLRRTFDFLSFAMMAFLIGIFKKTDVIIATSPQFFTTLSAYGLSILKRKPWVFEVRDIWPESIKSVGVMRESKLIRFFERLELFLYKKADAIIPVTPAFKSSLGVRGVDLQKMTVIPNGCNTNLFKFQEKDESLLEELGLTGCFLASYIGTHGMAHKLDFILKCAKKLEAENIKFLFVGSGAMKKKLVNFAKDLQLKNVVFVDPIRKELVPQYIAISDIALVPLRKSETFESVIPSKIFESAVMKKPVLLGVEGQAKEIIQKYKTGLCYEPENETDFLNKILKLKNDVKSYEKMEKSAESLVHDYKREDLAKKMFLVLKKIIKENV